MTSGWTIVTRARGSPADFKRCNLTLQTHNAPCRDRPLARGARRVYGHGAAVTGWRNWWLTSTQNNLLVSCGSGGLRSPVAGVGAYTAYRNAKLHRVPHPVVWRATRALSNNAIETTGPSLPTGANFFQSPNYPRPFSFATLSVVSFLVCVASPTPTRKSAYR